jgi:hypothetical protein
MFANVMLFSVLLCVAFYVPSATTAREHVLLVMACYKWDYV